MEGVKPQYCIVPPFAKKRFRTTLYSVKVANVATGLPSKSDGHYLFVNILSIAVAAVLGPLTSFCF